MVISQRLLDRKLPPHVGAQAQRAEQVHRVVEVADGQRVTAEHRPADTPATRTMHTASIYCQNLGFEASAIRQEEVLYGGLTTQSFIGILHELPSEVQTVFVFGHNPTVHSLAYNLVDAFHSDMPTCATIVIDFEVDQWKDVSARRGKITFQITPKSL